ncbi:helix-turn-helix transcriptional regulator [Actinoplanes sp. N902-109]|uniref:ArsR/SmtB family transcription factor n=1 Tax=Actinoplanes sp. (strain N902-109) TaxID=649831 RepID=UPI0003294E82|nr:helix-turn-helix domain-containing protein [Actinoplanes sp. N902-109]AGL17744.1 putative ArsR family transcriptional regulator [Actinoplanes sp. N902-109]
MTAEPRIVQDVDTLKALADPARLTMLELMMADTARAWTAKELAAAMALPPKKLYYHLGLLEQRGLLQVRSTQVVNGIIEKHYVAAQPSITFQRGPGGTAAGPVEEMGAVVSSLFEQVHTNIQAGLRSGRAVLDRQAPDAERVVVSYTAAGMAPEMAGHFRDSLLELVERFNAAASPDEPTFELLIAIHPRVPSAS